MSANPSTNGRTRSSEPLQTEQLSVPGLPDDFWSSARSTGNAGAGRSATPPSQRA
jgi:hypothetical protein